MKMHSFRPFRSSLALAVVLGLQPLALQAGPCDGNPVGQQKAQCDAAQIAHKAASDNKMVAMVYTGVAAVCTYACAMTSTGVGASAESYCNYSNYGGAAIDAIKSRDIAGALTSVVTSIGAQAMGHAGKDVVREVADESGGHAVVEGQSGSTIGGSKIGTSCITAAMAGIKAMTKFNSAKEAEKAAEMNTEQAGYLVTPNTGSNFQPGSANAPGTATSGSVVTAGGGGSSLGAATNESAEGAGGCKGGEKSGFANQVSCASASDSTIPSFVKDPNFAASLQKATGLSPDEFAAKVGSDGVGSTLGSTVAGLGGGTDAAAEKAAAIMAALQARAHDDLGGAYAGGGHGGGAGAGGGGEDSGIDKMMAGILAQFGGKKGEESKDGKSLLAFGDKVKRYPANVADDRRVSIFERVSNRYVFVSQRLAPQTTAKR